MFVHPQQIAEIVRRHRSIIRARLVVERPRGADQMTLFVELGEPAEDPAQRRRNRAAGDEVARRRQPRVPAGSLPDDGKLIEDRRELG